MARLRNIVMILLLIIVVSCSSMKNSMDSWIGHTSDELVAQWGYPTEIQHDGVWTVYVYKKYLETTYFDLIRMAGALNAPPESQPKPVGGYRIRQFYVDRNGVICRWWSNYM